MNLPIIDKNLSSPVSTQIYDWYSQRISSAELAPGQTLPSIRTIATSIDTSTTTVKRALDSLQNSGYLERDEDGKLTVAEYAIPETHQARWQAFWSYAHDDDENTHGAVSLLMHRICDEFAATTGEQLGIFQDAKDIPWGSNWKQVIDKNVTTSVFFIPILTPTYLHRPNCISEFSTAITNLSKAGIEDGIFPIVFVDITNALKVFQNKQIKKYISEHQYVNCSALRRIDPDGFQYRAKVGEIVDAMVALQSQLNSSQDKLDSRTEEDASSEDAGFLERVQMLEGSVPKIQNVARNLCDDLFIIGNSFNKSSDELKSNSGAISTAEKILTCRRLAESIEGPVDRFNYHSNEFVEDVHQFDAGISALPQILNFNENEHERLETASSLNNMIITMQDSSKPMFTGMRTFRETIDKIKNISRDLRPVLTSLGESCDVILGLEPVFMSWSNLMIDLPNQR